MAKDKKLSNTLYDALAVWYSARAEWKRSKPFLREKAAINRLIKTIRKTILGGNIDYNIISLQILQEMSLRHLSSDPDHQRKIRNEMEGLKIGLNHYRVLRQDPETYRTVIASGYRHPQDMVAPGRDVPNDGMQKALQTTIGHINARLSPHLSQSELELIVVQKELAWEIRRQYSDFQREVLGVRGHKEKRGSEEGENLA